MSDSEQSIKQLKAIKWLLAIIALCAAILAAGAIVLVVGTWQVSDVLKHTSGEQDFHKRLSDLEDQGKAKEMLELVDQREKTHPMDAYVYWYRGMAYIQLGEHEKALAAMERAHTLAPSWREEYIQPYLVDIKAEIAKKKTAK